MSIHVFRLRNGNCIAVDALSADYARKNAEVLAASEVVTVREVEPFLVKAVAIRADQSFGEPGPNGK